MMYKLDRAKITYLGIYKTLSATTKPTVTKKFVAGKKGTVNCNKPTTIGVYV